MCVCVLWEIVTGRVTRSFTVAMHVLLSALKRWKSVSECVCGLDKHRGKLYMHLSPSVCVCLSLHGLSVSSRMLTESGE